MNDDSPIGSVRNRLLAAADELFYEEGIHTVGIDRIIERADVAKASLYATFGSKDELVRAYLRGRDDDRRAKVLAEIERHTDPTERVLAVFDSLARSVERPSFRGCALGNASGESSEDSVAGQVTLEGRRWLLELLTALADDVGADDPALLGRQLALLYEGVNVQSRLVRDPASVTAARSAATSLIVAAATTRAPRARRARTAPGIDPGTGRTAGEASRPSARRSGPDAGSVPTNAPLNDRGPGRSSTRRSRE